MMITQETKGGREVRDHVDGETHELDDQQFKKKQPLFEGTSASTVLTC